MALSLHRRLLGVEGVRGGRDIVPSVQLLFVHATSLCKELWAPVMDEVAALLTDRQVQADAVAFDVSGHGESRERVPPGSRPWHDYVPEEVLEVLRETRRGDGVPLVGVGHSMGAAGLVFAELARPGSFDALVLCEPILPAPGATAADNNKNPMAEAARRRRFEWPSRVEAAAELRGRGMFADFEERAFAAYIDWALMAVPGHAQVRLKCAPEFEASMYARTPVDVWPSLKAVRCPVVVLAGSESRIFKRTTLEQFSNLATQFADGRCITLDGIGHFAPQQDAAGFARHVADMVAKAVRRSSTAASPGAVRPGMSNCRQSRL